MPTSTPTRSQPPAVPSSSPQATIDHVFASQAAKDQVDALRARIRPLATAKGVRTVDEVEAFHDPQMAVESREWLRYWKSISNDANAAAARLVMGHSAPYDGASGPPPKTAEEHARAWFRDLTKLRDALRLRYAATQEMLLRRRIKKVKVYRGIDREVADAVIAAVDSGAKTVQIRVRPLSSWTTDESVARQFGKVILTAEFPVEQVFSHHKVDDALDRPVGGTHEREVIVYAPEETIELSSRRVKKR